MSFDSILKQKSLDFGIEIVKIVKKISKDHNERVLSSQLLRSGTAIGALIREAEHASSKKDFQNKLSIALKEANETLYWLELLKTGKYLEFYDFEYYTKKCSELIRMLVSSIKTLKRNSASEEKKQ